MPADVKRKIEEFFERYPQRRFSRGAVIAQAGEDPPGILYLQEGRVSQYDISPGGSEVVVNVFQPPAFFPVSWAVNKTPNQYFFEASEDTAARLAPPEDVVRFLRSDPAVLFDLLSRVYKGTDGLMRRLAHLMGGDARSRLLFEIINSAHRFGRKDKNGGIYLPLNEGDLAKQSGLARETVNRVIQRLKADGLVEVKNAGLVVADIRELESELGTDL